MKPTCSDCHQEKYEIEPNKWVCENSQCLSSIHHADVTCPKCGERPIQRIDTGSCGHPQYVCKNGDEFSQMAKPRPELYRRT